MSSRTEHQLRCTADRRRLLLSINQSITHLLETEQVCVQLRTPVDNVTLLACAAHRHAAACRRLLQQSIDITCLPANPPHTAGAELLEQSTDGTDRRTPYRYIDPVIYYASSINKRVKTKKNRYVCNKNSTRLTDRWKQDDSWKSWGK